MDGNNSFANDRASSSGYYSYEPSSSGSRDAIRYTGDYRGDHHLARAQAQLVSCELTRNELRAEAAIHTTLVQNIIKDFCDTSERLEQIGAMVPARGGLQYWVHDSQTGQSILVAECVCLLNYAPEYRLRVPRDARLAFEALTTPDSYNNAMFHSLWIYLRYIEDRQTAQALGVQNQSPLQRPVPISVPSDHGASAAQPAPAIVVTRVNHIAIPQGARTTGIRPTGTSGMYQYEWPESRKLAWLVVDPRIATLPARALADSYCPLKSVALWDHVNVRLIGPNIEVNIVEIVAYFSRAASCWRALWKRFSVSGWTLSMLRMLIFHLRQLSVADLRAHSFGTMKKHRRDAQNHPCAAAIFVLESINTDRVGLKTEFGELRDCFLCSLGDGVAIYPQGADEGVLTVAVRHARLKGHNNVRLSQLEQYVVQENLHRHYALPGPSPVGVVQADEAARERIFPDATYDLSRKHDPNYDFVKKWWKAGGYFHGD